MALFSAFFRVRSMSAERVWPRAFRRAFTGGLSMMAMFRRSLSMRTCRIILAVAASAGVLQGVDGHAQDRGGQHGNLAERWADTWNSHDPDAVAALFTRDALFEDVPFAVVAHGPQEIRAVAGFFFTVVP